MFSFHSLRTSKELPKPDDGLLFAAMMDYKLPEDRTPKPAAEPKKEAATSRGYYHHKEIVDDFSCKIL